MSNKKLREDLDWASDLELFASALSSGLQIHDSLDLLAQRSSKSWRRAFQQISISLESLGSVSIALSEAKHRLADYRCDLFCELLIAHQQLGGGGLVEVITQAAEQARTRATANEDSASRIRSVLAVARLGVLSPWIMVAVLATRQDNLSAFETQSGLSVLAIGATITAYSWIVAKRLALMPPPYRGLAS
jgi:tight adherence protein B